MSFVTPLLLAGGLFVVVPIVMHLVMRPAPRLLEFPALRFLRMHREANRRRMQLRHLLLLALRCAAIGLLAMALARPSISGSGFLGGREAPVAAAFLFDTTPHMDYRHENQSRLDVARDLGLWLLAQLPSDSEVAVLESRSDSAEFALDLGSTKQRVERLQVGSVARPLDEMLSDALRLVEESEKLRKEVYIFTDLARSSWTLDAPGRLMQRLAELADVGVYVVDVGVEQPRNFGLGDLRLSAQVLAKNSPLRLETDLAHVGTGGTRSVGLFFMDADGEAQKRRQESYDWEADEERQIEFEIPGLAIGTHQGYIEIEGEDGLSWDDRRYFTIEVKAAWPVLIAATEPEYAIYLAQAIAPEAFRESDQAWFECTIVPLAALRNEELGDYAAVCLLDPAPLDASAWQQLADYAAGGGGVAIFLGRNATPLDSFNAAAAQQLLPGVFSRQSREQTYLAPESLQHPLLARFRAQAGSVPWSAFPVFKYWQFDSLADGASVVIPYSTNDPALVERPVGEGRVLTMTTPVSDPANLRSHSPWNILPTGPEP
ncbi:MAG: BatA domain-containing protein, partial [Thermoguttaceae bacterium]